jgi:hypothetical protein
VHGIAGSNFELNYGSNVLRILNEDDLKVAILSGQPLVASILPGKLHFPIVRFSQDVCDFLLSDSNI